MPRTRGSDNPARRQSVYEFVRTYARANQGRMPTDREISENVIVAMDHVYMYMGALVDAGLLRRKQRGDGTRCAYEIVQLDGCCAACGSRVHDPLPPPVSSVRRCACGAELGVSSRDNVTRCRSCARRERETVKPTRPSSPKPVAVRKRDNLASERDRISTVVREDARERLPNDDVKSCPMCLRRFRGEGRYCRASCEERAAR